MPKKAPLPPIVLEYEIGKLRQWQQGSASPSRSIADRIIGRSAHRHHHRIIYSRQARKRIERSDGKLRRPGSQGKHILLAVTGIAVLLPVDVGIAVGDILPHLVVIG